MFKLKAIPGSIYVRRVAMMAPAMPMNTELPAKTSTFVHTTLMPL